MEYKQEINRLIGAGLYEQAEKCLNDYKKTPHKDLYIEDYEGLIEFSKGNFKESLYHFQRANSCKLENTESLIYLAKNYSILGEYQKAYDTYKIILKYNKNEEFKSIIQKEMAKIEKFAVKEKKYKYKFSIVVPSRNSAKYLKDGIKTLLAQDYDDYEIVIGDNSSRGNNGIYELVNLIDSSKINYYRTDRDYRIDESFTYGISKAQGEYLTVISSTNGMLFHSLKYLDTILKTLDLKSLHWIPVLYNWPDYKGQKGAENFLSSTPATIPYNVDVMLADYKEIFDCVLNYTDLTPLTFPYFYSSDVIHRDLIDEMILRTGSIYKGHAYDMYFGFAFSYMQKKIPVTKFPLSIACLSGNSMSTGVALDTKKMINLYYNTNNKQINELERTVMLEREKLNFMPIRSKYGVYKKLCLSTDFAFIEAFLTAKDWFFPYDDSITFDLQEAINRFMASLLESEYTQEIIVSIYESLDDRPEIRKWFKNNYLDNRNYRPLVEREPFTFVQGIQANGAFNYDASVFGVKNVYDAAKLFRNLTGL